ncbi:MAG: type III pantothenate kinase [Ignavibacteriaceae bacterium]|jgi:type III pantothenate kinase
MLLACDIGNTNIKTGLFNDDILTEKKLFDNLESFRAYLRAIPVRNIAVSSVVPEITKKVAETSEKLKNFSPFIVTKDVKFNLKLSYDSPDTLGMDRLCSAEGAYSLFKASGDYQIFDDKTFILSVDLGTATTINILTYPDEFIGGIIAPGINMMFKSLNSSTAQLPLVSEMYYENFIGRNTASSIASGVINSCAGLIKSTINYCKTGMKAEIIKIFITGGNAEKVLPYLDFEYKFVPELVLLGIKNIFDKNNRP